MGCSFSTFTGDAFNEHNLEESIYNLRETIAERHDLFMGRYNAIRIQRNIDENYRKYFDRVTLDVKRFKLRELSEDQFGVLLAVAGLSRPEDERVRNVLFQQLISNENLQLQNVISYVMAVLTEESQQMGLGDDESDIFDGNLDATSIHQRRFKEHQTRQCSSLKRGPCHRCSQCGQLHFVQQCFTKRIEHLSRTSERKLYRSCNNCNRIVFRHPRNTQQSFKIFREAHRTFSVDHHNNKVNKKHKTFDRRSRLSKGITSRHYRTNLRFLNQVCEDNGRVYASSLEEDQVVPARQRNKQTNSQILQRHFRPERRVRFSLPELNSNKFEPPTSHHSKKKRVKLNLQPIVTIY